ncbi:hypothetical protein BUE76_15180 [Cnuella takakiae]|nr:hypothetical protein BUE76_15180 [Cnuella takakiae]
MYPEHTIEQVKLEDDALGRHLGLFAAGELRSVISLFQQGDSLQFRKFATLLPHQGKGFGKHLLQEVFAQAKADGLATIWCNARTAAAPLYQQFGMVPIGETWQQHGHQFVKMQVTL